MTFTHDVNIFWTENLIYVDFKKCNQKKMFWNEGGPWNNTVFYRPLLMRITENTENDILTQKLYIYACMLISAGQWLIVINRI